MLKHLFTSHAPKAITLAVVVAGLYSVTKIWRYYEVEPWTPDGRVRADIVQVSPDVPGIVTRLAVTNDQKVKRGQFLFQIDRERYVLALREAEAMLASQRVRLAQLRREASRNSDLNDLIAKEMSEQSLAKVAEAEAALSQAIANRDLAALNLQRTRVVAPADGHLSDLTLRVGNYVTVGKPVMALIDAHSFRVEGYFEETKLREVAPGQAAEIRLMGDDRRLTGHVQSIAMGIEDRDRASSANLLPNVNPTFSWVRLAQRIPVRVALDDPNDAALIAGRTASVTLLPLAQKQAGGAH